MHIVIFRFSAAVAYLLLLAVILGLGSCAKPDERNIWRDLVEIGVL